MYEEQIKLIEITPYPDYLKGQSIYKSSSPSESSEGSKITVCVYFIFKSRKSLGSLAVIHK